MYCGGGWDKLRQSPKYRKVFKKLADYNNFAVYGASVFAYQWDFIKPNYKGFIPADGKSFLKTASNHGITLVLHSQWHLNNQVPSGRIFEGAAASTIMICDNHKFTKDHFGDSVLYIDHTKDADSIYEQINNHMTWIKNNPLKASAKAKKAHEIFSEKFTLEKQLQRLSQL